MRQLFMLVSRWCLTLFFLAGVLAGCAAPVKQELVALEPQAQFVQTKLVGGLNSPTAMTIAPDGRIFVAYQGGEVRIVKNGSLLATPFVTVPTVPVDEQGIMGIALDSSFASNNYVYITYTRNATPRFQRIARFTANGDVAVAGSETTIFETNDSPNQIEYHLGGALHFGTDGKLYVMLGEGYTGDEQLLNNFAGKILRLNKDGSIPTDNPFYTQTTGKFRAIWAKGFRNPFSASVQPGTGKLFINDVGSGTYEEINQGVAGANYGFPNSEGYSVNAGESAPNYAYTHNAGRCAIVGGSFYNPATTNFPAQYVGKYFFTDYCTSQLFYIDPNIPAAQDAASLLLTVGDVGPVDVDVAPDGSMYVLTRGNAASGGGTGGGFANASIFKISYTNSQAPTIGQQPQNVLVSVGETATFSVVAGGQGLRYQWQKNRVSISGATSSSYTAANTTQADNGAKYRVIVRNSTGRVVSQEALLRVTGNRRPSVTITAPAVNATYRGGLDITYSGTGTDPEGAPLTYTWKIDLHHDQHVHPVLPPTTGAATGIFTVSRTYHADEVNVFLRFYLTISDGTLSATKSVDVYPRKTTFTLQSNPTGLRLTLNGASLTTPATLASVVGMTRTLGAVSPQTLGSTTYTFNAWSNGRAITHNVNIPTAATTYTATFQTQTSSLNKPIVDWYGDYVTTDTAMQRYITLENNQDLDADGATDDTRGYLPYSSSAPLNPNPTGGNAYGSTYATNSSYKFYGGILFQRYNGDFGSRWGEVWERSSADRIYQSADPTSDGWAFLFWKKADFLNGAAGVVKFDANSKLEVLNYSGADGIVVNNYGRVRFVVQDASQFYVSENYGNPIQTSLTLTNPNAQRWASYSPSAPYNVKFSVGSSFATRTFNNIQAVGVYHSTDNSTDPNRRAGLNFERFRVLAVTP
jgi:glucose/arabinose dehydrogenase